MRRILTVLALISLMLSGCAMGNRFDPFSPKNKNAIRDLNGKLEEQKTNQNGILLDLMKMHQEQAVRAGRDAQAQEGIVNMNGDGAIIAVIVITAILMGGGILIVYYRAQAVKQGQAAQIMAQQIALYDDVHLDNKVFAAAMNSSAEKHVYYLMVQAQNQAGKPFQT